MSERIDIREVPGSAGMFAAPGAAVEVKAEEKRFVLVPYAGQQFDHWYWGKMAFDISGMSLRKPVIPAFRDHDPGCLVGEIDAIDKRGSLMLSGSFCDTEDACEIQAAKKLAWDCSLAFDLSGAVIEEIGDQARSQCNGQEFVGPGVIVRQCQIHEVSFTHYGAVPGTETAFAKTKFSVSVRSLFEEGHMADSTHAEEVAKAATEARAAALAVHQRMVELCPEDPAFVAAHFQKGSTIEAFAVELARKRGEEIVKLKTPIAGAKPTNAGNGDAPAAPAPAPADFVALAKAHAAEAKLSVREAMSYIARTNPAAYEQFKKSCPVSGSK